MSDKTYSEQWMSLWTSPRLMIPGIVDGFYAWIGTRSWMNIFGTVPFLILFLSSLFAASYFRLQHREVVATPFVKQLEKEIPTKDLFSYYVDQQLLNQRADSSQIQARKLTADELKRADLLVRHAIRLDPQSQSLQFRSILIHALTGNGNLDQERIDSLAPIDRSSFVPAHAFCALGLLVHDDLSLTKMRILEHHLRAACGWLGADHRLFQIASEVFEKQKQMSIAIEFAQHAATLNPKYHMRTAELAKSVGMTTLYRSSLEQGLRYFQKQMEVETDTTDLTVSMASCQEKLDRISDALATLRGGVKNAKNDPEIIQSHLIDTLARAHAKSIDPSDKIWSGEVRYLEELAKMAPLHPLVGESVAAMVNRRLQEPMFVIPEACQTALKRQVEEKVATSRTCFLIAKARLAKQQITEAVEQCRLAIEKDPKNGEAHLCMAQCMLLTTPPNPDRARSAIIAAQRLLGESIELQKISGDVALSFGEIEAAIEHWNAACEKDETNNEIHRRLYDAYRRLGRKDDAEKHRKVIGILDEETGKPNPVSALKRP